MTLEDTVEFYKEKEAIAVAAAAKLKAALLRHRWWIFGLAVVIALLLLYMAFRKAPVQLAPAVRTESKPEYIYLDTAAARLTRRADSLQQVADYWHDNAAAALAVSDYYKKQNIGFENFITDVRNNAVADSIATKDIADYLYRYLGYAK